MNKVKSAHQKYYFNTIDEGEILACLESAVAQSLPVEIWEMGVGKNEVEKYSAREFDRDSRQLFLTPPGPSPLQTVWVSRYLGKEVCLKIDADKVQYFTYTKLNGHPASQKYWVSVKGEVYRTQQRFDYRLAADPRFPIQIHIEGRGEYSGIDVSVGGASFCVSGECQQHFAKGTIFKDCRIKLKGTEFCIPKAKVVGLWPRGEAPEEGRGPDQIQVGLAFSELPSSLEKSLFQIINDGIRAVQAPRKRHRKRGGGRL